MDNFNWKEFYERCDQFIRNWQSNPSAIALDSVYIRKTGGESSPLYKSKKCEYYKYMPEPFVGNPEDCLAVMLNLNPGYPMPEFHYDCEYAKSIVENGYSNESKQKGYEIFKVGENGGVKWWMTREQWLNRVTEGEHVSLNLKPFAIDICPWHSKSWGGLNYENELVEEIKKNVLAPAFMAVKNSRLPFAIAIGKDYYDVLNGNKYLGFTQKECVVAGCYNKQAEDLRVIKWPKNKNKKPVNKAFAIFENDNKDRILCIWCPDGGSNQPPQSGFDELVQNFVQKYKNNI